MPPWEKYKSTESPKPWEKHAPDRAGLYEGEQSIPASNSMLLNLGNTLSAEYLDEAYGGVMGAAKKLGSLVGQGEDKPLGDYYRQERDFARDRIKRSEKENPIASTVGSIAGYLQSAPKSIGKAVIQGGIRGVGRSEAENIPEMASDAASGAAGMAAGYGVGKAAAFPAQVLSKTQKYLGPTLKGIADSAGDDVANMMLKRAGRMEKLGNPVATDAMLNIGTTAESAFRTGGNVLNKYLTGSGKAWGAVADKAPGLGAAGGLSAQDYFKSWFSSQKARENQ